MPDPQNINSIVESSTPAAAGIGAYITFKAMILDPTRTYSPLAMTFAVCVTYVLCAGLPILAVLISKMDLVNEAIAAVGSLVGIFGGIVSTMALIKKTWPKKKSR
jgi:uncharacterized YccA/Bax inhibitor family protein